LKGRRRRRRKRRRLGFCSHEGVVRKIIIIREKKKVK